MATSEPTGWRRLLGNALVVALAGGFANLLTLGTTFAAARLLSTTNYGAYGQMTGVFFVVALPGSALGVAVVRRAGTYIVRGDHVLTAHWQRRLHQRVYVAAAVAAVVALPLSFPAAALLGHRSFVAVWLTALAGLVFAVVSVDRGLMQANQRYTPLASNLVVEGLARTVFILAGVAIGVTGYGAGLLVAELLTRAHAYRMVRNKVPVDEGIELEHSGVSRELAVALVTLGLLAVLQFLDVFVIGHAAAKGAGSYTAISQVAKTLVYLASILGYFLLPEAVLANRRGGEAQRQLALALTLLAVPFVLFAAVALVAAHPLLEAVFGARYSHASSSLLPLVLAMGALAISYLLAMFLLGDGARWPTAWLAVCTVVGAMWVDLGHGLWHATAVRSLETQVVVMVGLAVAVAFRLRRATHPAPPLAVSS